MFLDNLKERETRVNAKISIISEFFYSVKCTLVKALMLCTGRTAHRGSRGIAPLFLDHGTRRGWGVSVTRQPLFTPGKDSGTHCTGDWVGPRADLDSCGKFRLPPGFDPGTVLPVTIRYTDWANYSVKLCQITLTLCIYCVMNISLSF